MSYYDYLPPKLKDKYLESLNDPDALSVQTEIATLRAIHKQLLKSLDKPDNDNLWLKANDALTRKQDAQAILENNPQDARALAKYNKADADLTEVIQNGVDIAEKRAQIFDVVELINKVVTSESNRKIKIGSLIPLTVLLEQMGIVSSVLINKIQNKKLLLEITEAIENEVLVIDG